VNGSESALARLSKAAGKAAASAMLMVSRCFESGISRQLCFGVRMCVAIERSNARL